MRQPGHYRVRKSTMLLSYLRLVLFAIGLLVGVQVPGFINDYAKRVEAHLIEAQTGLRGFESTAQQFFNGDLQALVAHYRAATTRYFAAMPTASARYWIASWRWTSNSRPCKAPGTSAPCRWRWRPTRRFAWKPGTATATRSC